MNEENVSVKKSKGTFLTILILITLLVIMYLVFH